MKELGDAGIAKHGCPGVGADLEQYTGFSITMRKTVATFYRATVSQDYVRSVRAGGPIHGELPLRCHSFDLFDPGRQGGFLRLLLRLLGVLLQRPEASAKESFQMTFVIFSALTWFPLLVYSMGIASRPQRPFLI